MRMVAALLYMYVYCIYKSATIGRMWGGGEERIAAITWGQGDCGWAYYESPAWKIVIGLHKSLRVLPLPCYNSTRITQRTHIHINFSLFFFLFFCIFFYFFFFFFLFFWLDCCFTRHYLYGQSLSLFDLLDLHSISWNFFVTLLSPFA